MKKAIPIIIALLVVILIIACVMISCEIFTSQKEKNEFDQLTEQVNNQIMDSRDENEQSSEKIHTRNLQPLFEVNADCIGWLCIPDTELDYPVMYTPNDPHKYLHKNFEGEESSAGVPFLQEAGTLEDDHLIIYGHNMKNGSMFATLKKYTDQEFCQTHPTIEFETAEGLTYYDVFAVVQLKSDDAWYQFVTADDANDYEDKLLSISTRSLYKGAGLPVYGQQILTLSTCYGSNDDDRLIVVAAEQVMN